MKHLEWMAQMLGQRCFTGSQVMNSPKQWLIISVLIYTWLKVLPLQMPAHHLQQDDQVLKVCLHHLSFSMGSAPFLALVLALQQQVLLLLQAMVQPPRMVCAAQLHQLFQANVQKLAEVYSAVVNLQRVCFFCHLARSLEKMALLTPAQLSDSSLQVLNIFKSIIILKNQCST